MTNNLISVAGRIPVSRPVPTVAVNPVVLPAPGRGLPLEMRVTAPMTGPAAPIVLLSHGGGNSDYLASKDGYAPLADLWAAHGFAVLQPTHLSSRVGGFGLRPDRPGHSMFWRSRVTDMTTILDHLDEIEAQLPPPAGRLDRTRVAVAGHSAGAHTAGLLLGARVNGSDESFRDPRITAGVLLAPLGKDLSAAARARWPFLESDFTTMTTPTMIVYGDQDLSPHLTTRGPDWHADPYHLSPGADALLTLPGGKHFLGGILGYDLAETDDADPDRLATTARMTWAYLRSTLDPADPAWRRAREALDPALGTVVTRSAAG